MTDAEQVDRYLRSHWALSEIAAILHDSKRPTTFRTLQSWTTGQVLRIQPSLSIPGQRRRRYGLANLLEFVIAKRLLQIAGMPGPIVQHFLSNYGKESFVGGASFAEKMKGYFILAQTGPEEGEVFFFPDQAKFYLACKALIGVDFKWTTINLDAVLNEALERLDCWNHRVEYKKETAGEQVKRALNAVRNLNLSKGRPANSVTEK
jgi:hypothetical protein